jgi:hypothetical protein
VRWGKPLKKRLSKEKLLGAGRIHPEMGYFQFRSEKFAKSSSIEHTRKPVFNRQSSPMCIRDQVDQKATKNFGMLLSGLRGPTLRTFKPSIDLLSGVGDSRRFFEYTWAGRSS